MNKLAVSITVFLFILLFLSSFPLTQPNPVNISTQEQIDGNIRRVDYVDESGIITKHPSVLYATMIQIRDQDGNPVKEYYLDAEGAPVERSGGYYGVKRIYQDGLCTEYSFVDKDGVVINISSGYATVKQFYTKQNQLMEILYFDSEEHPVALESGQYGERREYDESGRNYITTYLDANGSSMEIISGYSTIYREYSADGKMIYEWYLELDGSKADLGGGRCGTRYVYEDGEYVRSVPVDADGKEIIHPFRLNQFLPKNPWIVGISAIALVLSTPFFKGKAKIGLLGLYVWFILYMTLFIRERGDQKLNLELFWSYRQIFEFNEIGLQALYNICLFIPLGALLCSLQRKPKWLLLAVGLSVFVESIQYFFGLGLCELDDIIGNSFGAWLGWGCFREGKDLLQKRKLYK